MLSFLHVVWRITLNLLAELITTYSTLCLKKFNLFIFVITRSSVDLF